LNILKRDIAENEEAQIARMSLRILFQSVL
jgi:hypothetical protein